MVRRICIVDDHPLIILGYKALLQDAPDMAVIGDAGSLEEGRMLIDAVRPDVAVVDIGLGTESGLLLMEHVAAHLPETAVLCISMHADEIYAEKAAMAGAMGYINKQSVTCAFLDAVRSVGEGRPYFSAKVQKRLLARMRGEAPALEPMRSLTTRESEILRFIGLGLTKTEISERIARSANTVEAHRTNIKRKLGVDSNNDLIRIALSAFPDIHPPSHNP